MTGVLHHIVSVMRRLVRVYGFIQTFSMRHKYTNVTFIQQTPPTHTHTSTHPCPPPPSRGRRSGPLPLLTRPRSCRRPPGGRPAAPAPRTRMFGLENDFPTPSAPFSNCPRGNYLVSFPLKKTRELRCVFQTKTKLIFF